MHKIGVRPKIKPADLARKCIRPSQSGIIIIIIIIIPTWLNRFTYLVRAWTYSAAQVCKNVSQHSACKVMHYKSKPPLKQPTNGAIRQP
jgi:hypothetical protein